MINEKEIREHLFLDEDTWKEFNKDIMKGISKYKSLLQQTNYCYCLESDTQREQDYLEENKQEMKIIANENGLIIYQIIPLMKKRKEIIADWLDKNIMKNKQDKVRELRLTKNMQIWLQVYDYEYCIELQVKEPNEELFGDYVMNIDTYGTFEDIGELCEELMDLYKEHDVYYIIDKYKNEWL